VKRQPAQTPRASGHRAGMTLVEMIVALAIFAVVTTVVIGFLTDSRRTYSSTSDRAHYQQSLRAVLSLLTREIRSAGCDPVGVGFDGIAMATDTSLRCRMDLNDDGNTLGVSPDEDITYVWDPAAAELQRTTIAGTQIILRDVQRVQFSYFDRQGAALLATPLSPDDLARVRFVEITIEGVLRRGEPVEYTTRVHLRNG
jgi:prepilin-type N-terminal cleavage/methylation domain-containing protein